VIWLGPSLSVLVVRNIIAFWLKTEVDRAMLTDAVEVRSHFRIVASWLHVVDYVLCIYRTAKNNLCDELRQEANLD
jgi:hypothetical protein